VNAQDQDSQAGLSSGASGLLWFAGGALLGALAVALTTPRTGPQVRHKIRAFGRRARRKAGVLGDQAEAVWTETVERTGLSAADLKRGLHEAAEDFKRGLREASQDLRHGARAAAADLRAGEPAAGAPLDNAHVGSHS
jgi:gas vesicle protein